MGRGRDVARPPFGLSMPIAGSQPRLGKSANLPPYTYRRAVALFAVFLFAVALFAVFLFAVFLFV